MGAARVEPAPLTVAAGPLDLELELELELELVLDFELLEPQAATNPARTMAIPIAVMRFAFKVFLL